MVLLAIAGWILTKVWYLSFTDSRVDCGVILETLPEVKKLSLEEKRQLVDEMEGSTHEQLRPEIVALLNERMDHYRKDPSSARPWSEVRKSQVILAKNILEEPPFFSKRQDQI
ncbi:MAG: hypothetical protein ACI8T1_004456 [Verrucomicrobiales bacterium]|jgi:hypothetical protein